MMDSTLAPESIPTEWFYIIVGGVIVFGLLALLLQACILKFSIKICGGDEVGIFYASFATIALSIAGGVFSVGGRLLSPDESQWTYLAIGVLGSILAMCILLKMNPFRAFGVYLLYTIFGSIAMTIFGLLAVFGVMASVPREVVQNFKEQTQAKLGEIHTVSLNGGDVTNQAAAGEDVNHLLQGLNIPSISPTGSPEFSADNPPSSEDIENSLQGIMKQIESAMESNSTGGKLGSEGTENPHSESHRNKTSPTPSSPFGSAVKSNPFVKP